MKPQQHYQVVYSPQSDTYQVQHYATEPRIKSTYSTTYPTYLAALEAAAAAASAECPLLAWGYTITGPQDEAAIAAAARWQAAYGECLETGRRYEATGDARVFINGIPQIRREVAA